MDRYRCVKCTNVCSVVVGMWVYVYMCVYVVGNMNNKDTWCVHPLFVSILHYRLHKVYIQETT